MFYFLTSALNDRIIQELRRFWSYDPHFKELVDHIQGKFSWKERPQAGIIVKTGGATSLALTWDHFGGVQYSYCGPAKVGNHPGLCIEWIREDSTAIQNNGGVFPSSPGVYFIEITKSDMDQGLHEFTVDPKLTVIDETLMMPDTEVGVTSRPFIEGTLQIYEIPSGFLLTEEEHYTADPSTGEIFFVNPMPEGVFYSVDYRYQGEVGGPFQVRENRAHYEAIPGVVLAFGRRVAQGDQVSVIVSDRREPSALEYHGKWEMPIELELFARDVNDARYIADQTVMYLMFVLRDRLSWEGIEITEASLGGEMEDIYDENADDYLFGSSISMSAQTNWFVQVPLPARIKQLSCISTEDRLSVPGLSNEEVARVQSNIEILDNMGLRSFEDPWFKDRSKNFEMIK